MKAAPTLLTLAAVSTAAWLLGVAWGQERTSASQPATQSAVPPARGRGFGRGALPGATPQQLSALADMTTALAQPTEALAKARTDLLAAEFAPAPDDKDVQQNLAAVSAAELALAYARVAGLEKLQKSDTPLTSEQIKALADREAAASNPRFANAPQIPHMTSRQVAALTDFTGAQQKTMADVARVRTGVTYAALAEMQDEHVVQQQVELLAVEEAGLASLRAKQLAVLQSSPEKLDEEQLRALAANNGVLVSGSFHEPLPYDFNNHTGYVSLFDGKTLNGWDGNPKFWRVEEGAIVGESTAQNPSGNTYIACRTSLSKDFTLKCEIKIEGSGGSGIQYRSNTGIPWLTAIPANVIANAGPTNLAWMMTGPQADFWPSRDSSAMYSGQFYSENTPMRIMAFRGQVVEGFGMGPRRLMGTIGDRADLGKFIKQNDWNQYIVIARGGTFLHIINGQLMSVMIDDDPDSSNNQPGLIGLEIEATTKVSARDIWLKKLD
ncbi:MAG TPA: family 16 glycoside hydrolase [Phycisphaerae bacterium]|nr:family 16 glycoside hydrolase [Phycisphaerae bacterium]